MNGLVVTISVIVFLHLVTICALTLWVISLRLYFEITLKGVFPPIIQSKLEMCETINKLHGKKKLLNAFRVFSILALTAYCALASFSLFTNYNTNFILLILGGIGQIMNFCKWHVMASILISSYVVIDSKNRWYAGSDHLEHIEMMKQIDG